MILPSGEPVLSVALRDGFLMEQSNSDTELAGRLRALDALAAGKLRPRLAIPVQAERK